MFASTHKLVHYYTSMFMYNVLLTRHQVSEAQKNACASVFWNLHCPVWTFLMWLNCK